MKHIGALQPANDSDELSAMEQSVDPVLLASVKAMLARGWALTPIHAPAERMRDGKAASGKEPCAGKEWPRKRMDYREILRHLAECRGRNVGIILGAASGGLCDIDIDNERLLKAAALILPRTGAVFGRTSRRRSHWLYIVEAPIPTRKPRGLGLELRCATAADLSVGVQSVAPGSVHHTGERVEWDEAGEPARIKAADLIAAFERLKQAARDLNTNSAGAAASSKPVPASEQVERPVTEVVSVTDSVTGETTIRLCNRLKGVESRATGTETDLFEQVASRLPGQITATDLRSAVQKMTPTESGCRNTNAHGLARLLKINWRLEPQHLIDLRPLVDEQHRRARLKGFANDSAEKHWDDFCRAWRDVKYAVGSDVVDSVWLVVREQHGAGLPENPKERLSLLCEAMQASVGDMPFFLSSTDAARCAYHGLAADGTMAISDGERYRAWRCLKRLIAEGRLECVKRGSHGAPGMPANRYRWLG